MNARSWKAQFATFAAMLIIGGGTAAFGQASGDLEASGPIVSLEADGGQVNATGASVSVTGRAAIVRAAGAVVDVRSDVEGEVQVAGAQVSVTGTVGGKVRAAGASVDLRGSAESAELAGAIVNAEVVTSGNLRAAGATVTIGAGSEIGGDLSAGAAVLTINGRVSGNAEIGGRVVTFNGESGGNVTASGNRVVIGPAAVIAGDLIVHGRNEPEVRSGAQIAGEVKQEAPRSWWNVPGWAIRLAVVVFLAASIFVAGLVAILLARGSVEATALSVRERPFRSALIGLATLVLVPIAAFVLMATGVGLAIGLSLLLLLPLLLLIGLAASALTLAGWREFRDDPPALGRSVVLLILGALVVSLLGLLPYVGPWIVALIVLLGTGAFVSAVLGRLRAPPRAELDSIG